MKLFGVQISTVGFEFETVEARHAFLTELIKARRTSSISTYEPYYKDQDAISFRMYEREMEETNGLS